MNRFLLLSKCRFFALLLFLLLQAAAIKPLFAQPIAIVLDPSKTRIEFTLGAALHTVHGTFKLRSGHIEVNPADKTISGLIVIDSSSGESGSDSRDKRMKKDILEAGRFPQITFTPTAYDGDVAASSSPGAVTGWFAIHGERHKLSIPMQLKMSRGEVVAAGKFVVPYVAWGMKNPSTFVLRVNQQVEVEVSAVGSTAQKP